MNIMWVIHRFPVFFNIIRVYSVRHSWVSTAVFRMMSRKSRVTATHVTGGTLDFVTNDMNTAQDEKFIRLKINQKKQHHQSMICHKLFMDLFGACR